MCRRNILCGQHSIYLFLKREIPKFVLLLICFPLFAYDALAELPYLVSRKELTMMPPYCTALYGKYHGEPQPGNHPLRGTIPNCPSVHHYCDGLKFIIRANGALNNPYDLKYYLQNAEQSFRSVIEEWKAAAPDCELYPEAYTNLGNNLLRSSKIGPNRIGDALTNFEAAIQKNNKYIPAYIGLSDAYLIFNKKDKSINALERGLQQNPTSKQLAKKYKSLGGNPETVLANMPAQTIKQTDAASAHTTQSVDVNKFANNNEILTEPVKTQDKAQTNTLNGTSANPWCRFCPDTKPSKK